MHYPKYKVIKGQSEGVVEAEMDKAGSRGYIYKEMRISESGGTIWVIMEKI